MLQRFIALLLVLFVGLHTIKVRTSAVNVKGVRGSRVVVRVCRSKGVLDGHPCAACWGGGQLPGHVRVGGGLGWGALAFCYIHIV